MCECAAYKKLAKELEAARKAKDWDRCVTIQNDMAAHVQQAHPELTRNYGLASAFVTKAREGK